MVAQQVEQIVSAAHEAAEEIRREARLEQEDLRRWAQEDGDELREKARREAERMLEQAREQEPRDPGVNRALARLYEQQGRYSRAIALWELVRKVDPTDVEAPRKINALAAKEAIARGHYDL